MEEYHKIIDELLQECADLQTLKITKQVNVTTLVDQQAALLAPLHVQ